MASTRSTTPTSLDKGTHLLQGHLEAKQRKQRLNQTGRKQSSHTRMTRGRIYQKEWLLQQPGTVLESCCSHSIWPQTQWLKTTQIYCLTVSEVRSLTKVSLDWNRDVPRAVLLSGIKVAHDKPLKYRDYPGLWGGSSVIIGCLWMKEGRQRWGGRGRCEKTLIKTLIKKKNKKKPPWFMKKLLHQRVWRLSVHWDVHSVMD